MQLPPDAATPPAPAERRPPRAATRAAARCAMPGRSDSSTSGPSFVASTVGCARACACAASTAVSTAHGKQSRAAASMARSSHSELRMSSMQRAGGGPSWAACAGHTARPGASLLTTELIHRSAAHTSQSTSHVSV
eukprot:359958-Chlamydomonas_euryale.AAC.1